jgi:hypothetical protein
MAIFDRVETYVMLAGTLSLVVLAVISTLVRRDRFNISAIFAAFGFVVMMCVASFLTSDYAIENSNRRDLVAIGERAEGTIINFEHVVDHGRGGRSRDCPVVQFIASDGISRNITVQESHCSDSVDKRELPRHVAVAHLRAKPDVARVLEWQPAPPVEERSIGLACMAGAAFFLWLYSVVR